MTAAAATLATAKPGDKPAGPLEVAVFRALWIATIVSNVGAWMQSVGAAWLMTSLAPAPLMVALVQAASTVPMFLFALPGGVLADIVDRRWLLISSQVWAALAGVVLVVLTLTGLTGPWLLLVLTFLIASGTAVSAPAFQAIVPELVPRPILADAVALNSLGVNISRVIGPALGGIVIAASGPPAVFALNAVSVTGVVVVLLAWRPTPQAAPLPPEHFFGALRSGARFARQSPELQTVLIRSLGFFPFGSALRAFLPIIARDQLGLGPTGYGGLLAAMGAGAIAGALLLPRIRRATTPNRAVARATLVFAAANVALGLSRHIGVASLAMAACGLGWLVMLSTLNVAAQFAAPAWVRARAMSVYMLVFQGALAAGSVLWGLAANATSIPVAMALASAGFVVGLPLAARWPLVIDAARDFAPSGHWPDPVVAANPAPDRGPVLVLVEYQVDPARVTAFTTAMNRLGRTRRRDGALTWGVYEDAARPGAMLESFVVESWLELLRQHARVTHADEADEALVRAFQIGPEPPTVRHLLTPEIPGHRHPTQPRRPDT